MIDQIHEFSVFNWESMAGRSRRSLKASGQVKADLASLQDCQLDTLDF